MILKKRILKKASSAIEFMALMVFLMGAFVVFQKYILQAFWGQWKRTGDSFGHGRQYDPREFGDAGMDGGTLECMYVYDNPANALSAGEWVIQPCYDTCMENPAKTSEDCRGECGRTTLSDADYCY